MEALLNSKLLMVETISLPFMCMLKWVSTHHQSDFETEIRNRIKNYFGIWEHLCVIQYVEKQISLFGYTPCRGIIVLQSVVKSVVKDYSSQEAYTEILTTPLWSTFRSSADTQCIIIQKSLSQSQSLSVSMTNRTPRHVKKHCKRTEPESRQTSKMCFSCSSDRIVQIFVTLYRRFLCKTSDPIISLPITYCPFLPLCSLPLLFSLVFLLHCTGETSRFWLKVPPQDIWAVSWGKRWANPPYL